MLIVTSLKGGSTQIWVTPNDLITEKHWEKIMPYVAPAASGNQNKP